MANDCTTTDWRRAGDVARRRDRSAVCSSHIMSQVKTMDVFLLSMLLCAIVLVSYLVLLSVLLCAIVVVSYLVLPLHCYCRGRGRGGSLLVVAGALQVIVCCRWWWLVRWWWSLLDHSLSGLVSRWWYDGVRRWCSHRVCRWCC